jgi:uncharacterized protein with HEPN domain
MIDANRDQTYISHMIECIQRIDGYVSTGKESFTNTALLQDAVMRVLQVMAESSQRLSLQAKAEHPEIDWRSISGFRNILVHDYLGGIDLELIWQVIAKELPLLKKALLGMQEN